MSREVSRVIKAEGGVQKEEETLGSSERRHYRVERTQAKENIRERIE